ncbi:hypothetical protein PL373_11025 [Tenacibaculum maritimum]|nr:hypothetical protein [Tenacibaculum maritimum]MDB0601604.1 hypothetical protein [Tenacibaculum maritimum]MDB0601619.1 hypothetical protein [Tenacibaculum maritimum]MDB0601672.1 hypothetical protein [Tenacibaculum maritimum]MDB0612859.1 hypothetical protein [Tenacibaculum maritimum]
MEQTKQGVEGISIQQLKRVNVYLDNIVATENEQQERVKETISFFTLLDKYYTQMNLIKAINQLSIQSLDNDTNDNTIIIQSLSELALQLNLEKETEFLDDLIFYKNKTSLAEL